MIFVGPGDGEMACGEFGPGRMAEPLEIVAAIGNALAMPGPLSGMKALVTAGPTQEPLDPVRFIANRSSGRQGYAIAAALAHAGAETILVSGPTAIAPPPSVKLLRVETAREMLAACESVLPVDVAVCTAAVADWRPETLANQKIKKDGTQPTLKLTANSGHPADAVAWRAAPIPRHRLRGRNRERRRLCAGKTRAQGLRLDRRQRRQPGDRHHGRREEHSAPHHIHHNGELARDGQDRSGTNSGGAHRRCAERRSGMNLSVLRLPHAKDLPLPSYATDGSAGIDLLAAIDGDVKIAPGARAAIPCGIAIAMSDKYEAQVRARSGLALNHGVTLLTHQAPSTATIAARSRRSSSIWANPSSP